MIQVYIWESSKDLFSGACDIQDRLLGESIEELHIQDWKDLEVDFEGLLEPMELF